MKPSLLIFAAFALAAPVTSSAESAGTSSESTSRGAADATRSEGEIRKVDPEAKKITIRHGELRNLDMPAMTMVFQVKDPAMIEQVKPGDRVRFRADKLNGTFTVMEIEVVK